MNSHRRMRSARKLRRIQLFTILIWCLGLFVFWLIRSLTTLTGAPEDLAYISENNVTHLIYFVLMVVALIVVLLVEALIFSKRSGKPYSSAIDPPESIVEREPHLSVPSRIDV